MLSFHLDVEPEIAAWSAGPGGWRSGRSWIAPFRHPALEDFAVEAEGELLIVVRERCRGMAGRPPARVDADTLARIADEAAAWPLQSVSLWVSRSGSMLRMALRSGSWATAPVYLAETVDGLWGDWDPA